MKNCCNINNFTKKCIRNDKKILIYQENSLINITYIKKMKGFTMKASCAPFKYCKKKIIGGTKKI